MAKRGKRGKRAKRDQPRVTSIPLNLGFVWFPQLVPAGMIGVIATLLYEVRGEIGGPIVIWALAAVAAGLALLRLPSLIRTIFFDRHILLGEEVLHIPVVRFFQFRPWDIPFREIESISTARESGSSTRIILVLRDGRLIVLPSAYVNHYPSAVDAISRRV